MKLAFLLMALMVCGCKYTFSPYTVEMPKLLQNPAALKRITAEEAALPPDYKVAVISDTHNYYDDLYDLVQQINSNGPYAFTIVTGDITNDGMREEFLKTKRILDGLNSPYLVIIGNHDLLSNGDEIYGKLFGPKNFTFVHRDITFIAYDNNNWESQGPVPDYSFLERELSAVATPWKVLLTHVSPEDKDRFSVSEITRTKSLVTLYGVDLIFNGHDHNPGASVFGGATRVTVGAPSKRVYSELIFENGVLDYQKVNY